MPTKLKTRRTGWGRAGALDAGRFPPPPPSQPEVDEADDDGEAREERTRSPTAAAPTAPRAVRSAQLEVRTAAPRTGATVVPSSCQMTRHSGV